ncbi:hypothetical protein UlMin_016635 [Ulmus minor]
MAEIVRLVVIVSVLASLFISSGAQTCSSYTFTNGKSFTSCADLPLLNSFLHWTRDNSTGKLDMAYRHTGVTDSIWVAWAINPSSLNPAMPGAQSLVAYPQSGSAPKVYTSPIQDYRTQLAEGDLQYNVSNLTATYENSEMIIFATWSLPTNMTSINQVWQEGPVSGGSPQVHATGNANINSKASLDLLSGQSATSSGGDRQKKRNTHGVLNAVSWGILMPTGAVIARYLKVFKSADPAWFYLHVTCQTSAYVIGVAGWGTGLKLGSDSVGVTQNPHRNIGIALFCLGTLQVFALLLRPKKDHKFRLYWNIYHHAVGYTVIILSIYNIYEGFDILNLESDKWKRAYTGVIIALGAIAILLEAYTWFFVLKRKRTESKTSHATNGVNGYANGSRV